MVATSSVTLEVPDPVAAEVFYAAFDVGEDVTVRASAAPATTMKPAKKGFWAYGGGVPMDGAGSHRIAIVGDAGTFTDPDGFAWEAARVRHENRETT